MTEPYNFSIEYMNLFPRARYHKGEKLIIIRDYKSQVKMSHAVKVPKGTILEVVETLFPDEMLDETLIRCRNKTVSTIFDFCVPEKYLLPCTDMDRLLYG